METFGVKDYGILIRKLANLYNTSEDMYAGAKALLDYSAEYYLTLRSAFRMLFELNSYPQDQKLVTTVYDEFTVSDDVRKAFFTRQFYDNIDLQIDFSRHNLDFAFLMYVQVQLPLHALAMTAHPELYPKDDINYVMEKVIKPVITDSPEFRDGDFKASLSLFAKKRLQLLEEITKQKETQDNTQGKQDNDQEKEHPENDKEIKNEKKYDIIAERTLFEIYNFLKETKVISRDTGFETFKKVVELADATIIKPKTKWKYNAALSLARECIKQDSLAWTRDICSSLKIASNKLTKNIDKESLWYKELEELFKKSLK